MARLAQLHWRRRHHVLVRMAQFILALIPQFMETASNVVIEGCTGTGKSFLACCLAKQACRMRRSARYVRLPDLLMKRDELAATERSDAKILKKYARYELLRLDE